SPGGRGSGSTPARAAGRGSQGRIRAGWGRDGPAAHPLRPRREGGGAGGGRAGGGGGGGGKTGGGWRGGGGGGRGGAPRGAGAAVESHRAAGDCRRLWLECCGPEVAVASTGPDGVRGAEEYRPDVVLCDIGLPGLDGYGVARQLRGNPATAGARLIAVTAYGRDEDRRRSHEAGFEQHLVKPVDPDDLRRVLEPPWPS